ncbi:DNA topoisomerase 3-beta-1-like [Limulus polyphemus]|uniref:DNA topoisomerase 3-beta-1-like n=1 Tax=Limulus polyphemus TaxID=6850 RepID=A0ABM1RWG9_LIMPO|nr:DNA topoisomerase 3-beta-1-like [Limulus polyphemus]
MRKLSGCNSCTHPSCPHSMQANGLASCSQCDNGVLVLDPASGPKWKLTCNRCDVIIHLFEDAHKVSVEEDTCEDCTSQLISVEYKAEKSKLNDGATEAVGCIFCDPQFGTLVERQQALRPKMLQGSRSQGASRGRGRGRGRGRPKSRGRGKPKDKMAKLAAYFV